MQLWVDHRIEIDFSLVTSPLMMQVPDSLITQVQVSQFLRCGVDWWAGGHFPDPEGSTDVEGERCPGFALMLSEHYQHCSGSLELLSVWDDLLEADPLVQPVGVGLHGQFILFQPLEQLPGHGALPLPVRAHPALQVGWGPADALSLGVKPLVQLYPQGSRLGVPGGRAWFFLQVADLRSLRV